MNPSKYQQNNSGISFERYLEINKYPVERRPNDDSLYIPGQYVVRKPDVDFLNRTFKHKPINKEQPNNHKGQPEDYSDSRWQQLFAGEQVDFSVYKPVEQSKICQLWCRFLNWLLFWRPKKDCKTRLRRVAGRKIRVKIISACHCCSLQVVEVLPSNGLSANEIPDLLRNDAVIAPGDGSQPTSASLEVFGQNQYAAAYDPGQVTVNQNGAEASGSIDLTEAIQLYGGYEPKSDDSDASKAIKVAVIDTGFRKSNIKSSQGIPIHIWNGVNEVSSCQMINDFVGWNFVGQPSIAAINVQNGINTSENNNPDDDNPGQHGTLISAIISQKAAQLGIAYQPEIMVLKAFDSNGIGSMFTIVCALCYAEKHNADVINASFVVPSNKAINYLEDCLKRLEQKKVVVVCAAGNREDVNAIKGTNLDTKPLYPASFSENFTNILTVTTVWEKGEDTGSENYSDRAVNVGVWANHPDQSEFGYFKPPYELISWPFAVQDGIVGSSFATPVVTGIVSAKIGSHNGIVGLPLPNGNIREALLGLMLPQNGPNGFIKDNHYVQA